MCSAIRTAGRQRKETQNKGKLMHLKFKIQNYDLEDMDK